MTKPEQNLSDRFDCFPFRNERPADHHNRQRKIARGFDLGRGGASAGIPRHDDVGTEIFKHGPITCTLERPARDNHLRMMQRQRIARPIDQPHQINMLRTGRESLQMLPADAEEYSSRLAPKSFRGSDDMIDFDPVVVRQARPGCPLQRQQRYSGYLASGDRVRTHLCGEWMGCIDDAIDILRTKIVREAGNSAETADAPGNRRRQRILGTAGVGQHRIDSRVIRKGTRKPVRIGGATEDQNAEPLRWRGCHDRQQ